MRAWSKTGFSYPTDKMDDAMRFVQGQLIPQLQQIIGGFKGFTALGDRQGGKLLGVALLENEEALSATEVAASRIRGAQKATGGTGAGVENYEVSVYEVPS
jgi:hypothetical protein